MRLKDLLKKFLVSQKELILTGAAPQFKRRELAAIGKLCDWADRRGYEVVMRPRGNNGPAVFCAKCGGFIENEKN